MYFPPLFASVRPFDPRANPLGGEAPTVTGRAENPLDLSVKNIRSDSCAGVPEELLMLDHRKLASLAASHSLSAMGRQFAPGMIDPALFRLGYGQDSLVPPPFCYDRATGVAVPNTLAGHQLMSNFLQQRENRCLEQQQQQALFAARTAAQQAAVAAAFMDPGIPFNLRGAALSQREALAASRGLYHPALPTPMVLPAFSLYTDDKGAFTSLRGANAAEKSFLNGNTLEAARFADHVQRLREQQLQAATKCCSTPTAISSLGHTVPCACCVQSPSQTALCARSPLGCVKDPTTAATAKVCNAAACDYLQPGLTYLHRPTVATAAPTELRLPVANFVTATSFGSGSESSSFQPTTTWNVTVPTVSTTGKTAFSVPKKKEVKELLKDSKILNGSVKEEQSPSLHERSSSLLLHVKKEPCRRDNKEVVVVSDPYHVKRKEHDVKSMLTPKVTLPAKITGSHLGCVAHTTVTSSTPVVPTKCEGGTIPKTKQPPVLEPYAPVEFHAATVDRLASDAVSSPQGPPPLISVSNGGGGHLQDKKPFNLSSESSVLRHQALLHSVNLAQNKADSKKCQKKQSTIVGHSNGLPCYVKDEPVKPLPKPVPQLPQPAPHFAGHFAPYNWLTPSNQTSSTSFVPGHAVSTAAPAPTFSGATTIKKEQPEYDNSPNVLQSLLVRPNLQRYAVPSNFSLIDYSVPQHHFNFNRHATGLVVESSNPAAPADNKHEIKVENHTDHDSNQQSNNNNYIQHHQQARKRPCSNEHKQVEKKRAFTAADYASIQHAYEYPQYASPYTNDAKDSPKCPYTFIPEPPGFFEGKIGGPREFRPFKAAIGVSSNFNCEKAMAQNEILYPSDLMKVKDTGVVFPNRGLQMRTAKRTVAARAKSRFRKRLLSRIYYRRQRLMNVLPTGVEQPLEKAVVEQPSSNQTSGNFLSQIATSLRQRRILRKIARRRKIRSGLDMALKHKKKKKPVYKIVEEYHQDVKAIDASGMHIPSEMKKLMVNKALGETVLHRAARMGYLEVVAYCLETNCANVNACDNAGYTPLHECCTRGNLDIARALLQYGADVNASAAGGIRPLHDAAENDQVEIVRLLLSYGADPTIATYSGLTPLKMARSPMMAEFLHGFLADISGEVDCRPHLPWRFWGSARCLDPDGNGYDVFEGAPSDDDYEVEGEGDDFLFEVSDSPHLPTFRLAIPNMNKTHCNFLRLSDVLRKTYMTKEHFAENFGHIEVITIPRHEFESNATCSQLLTGSKLDTLFASRTYADGLEAGPTVDLVCLDNNIRKLLDIETISVR